MEYLKPNFSHEWEEATRYPEFEEMGKENFIKHSQHNFEISHYNSIKDVLGNVDLDFDNLEDDKKKRFEIAFKHGKVEIPLAVKFGENDYDLLGGNTRLAGLVKNKINPKIWVIDMNKANYCDGCDRPKGKCICNKDRQMKEEDTLRGGLADGKTIQDVAKKHKMDADLLKIQLDKGIKVESGEHTDDKEKAKEIAMDHLWEDPTYYIKLKKMEKEEEVDEMMGAASAGGYNGDSAFGGERAGIKKLNNFEERKIEATEATGASSSGSFESVPFGGKNISGGRKNPLKIDGPDSIYKNRAVKDKKWPKFGGPGGYYVKPKKKCEKFPYCNQGNTGALEFIHENKAELIEAIEETAKKLNVPYEDIQKIVINEIKQIFI
jgi:hypothetical protein